MRTMGNIYKNLKIIFELWHIQINFGKVKTSASLIIKHKSVAGREEIEQMITQLC